MSSRRFQFLVIATLVALWATGSNAGGPPKPPKPIKNPEKLKEERINRITVEGLTEARWGMAATVNGNFAYFGGGTCGNSLFKVIDAYDALHDTWAHIANLPTPRWHLAAIAIDDLVVFLGGENEDCVYSDGIYYDTRWKKVVWGPFLKIPRASLAATTVGHYGIWFGGKTETQQASDAVEFYDSITHSMDTRSHEVNAVARWNVAATTVGVKAIFFGGQKGDTMGDEVGSVDIYDYSTNKWYKGPEVTCRTHVAAATVGDVAVFVGGAVATLNNAQGSSITTVVDVFDSWTNTWTTTLFPSIEDPDDGVLHWKVPRYYIAATNLGALALFAGGKAHFTHSSDDVNIYNAFRRTWIKPGKLSLPKWGAVGLTVRNKAMIVGGATNNNRPLSHADIFSFPPPRDPMLEWIYSFNCEFKKFGKFFKHRSLKSTFINVDGIVNANEWECERFTLDIGRETTSCLPSQLVVKPLILRRPLSKNDDFWRWRDEVARGDMKAARAYCEVVLFDRSYTPQYSFRVVNSWPSKIEIETHGTMNEVPEEFEVEEDLGSEYELPPQKAALVEKITLIHEGITRWGHSSENKALGKILVP